jgi:hypothetical protein
MTLKKLGRIVAAVGALGLLISLAANPLGIGTNPDEFGWLQMLGSVLGCLLIVGGLWVAIRTK